MNVPDLTRLLDATTTIYRKGPAVVAHDGVVEVFGYPPASAAPPTARLIDVHFLLVGVDVDAAGLARAPLRSLLATYDGPNALDRGPSYIEVGAVLGGQEEALRLFAVGEVLGWWTVVTPATLGITGEEADELAGRGLVMVSGYQPDPTVAPS
jgi:hypothetical protein